MPAENGANPVPPPVPPPVITKPPTSLATPGQMQSVTALYEPEQAKPSPQPARTSNPREAANQAKKRLEDATTQWQQEVAGGLTPKGNARWRSYTAALRSIWQQHETLARDWDRKGKSSGKAAGPAGGNPPDNGLADMEKRITDQQPNALKQIKELTQTPNAYRHMVEQYHNSLFPELAGKKAKTKPREAATHDDDQNSLFSEGEGQKPTENPRAPSVPSGAIPPDERSAMSRLGIDPSTGKPGGRRLGNPQWRNARNAFNKGSQESRTEVEARLRREAAAGPLAPDVPHPEQPKPIEGSSQWKGLVKQKAAEWDMKPEDFDSLADDLHRQLSEHWRDHSEAQQAARKALNMTAGDINRLENTGFDSGSKHAKIKQLDTVGRELAAQYPGLGWGPRPRR
jgi:hypothetical protein